MVATRAAGDWIGEMALLESAPRAASVTSEGATRALRIPLSIPRAVTALAAGETVAIDLGRLDDGRVFAFAAGVGIDATIGEGIPRERFERIAYAYTDRAKIADYYTGKADPALVVGRHFADVVPGAGLSGD